MEGLSLANNDYTRMQSLMQEILEVRYTDLEQQRADCTELLALAEQQNYNRGRAFALTYLADYHLAGNNSREACQYLVQARALCQQNNYTELLMNVNLFYGIYFDMLLDRQMAFKYTLDALELATLLGDSYRKSVILNNIANNFEFFGDIQAAKTYYSQALDCARAPENANKSIFSYAMLITNLVNIHCRLGELQEAEELTRELAARDPHGLDGRGQYYLCLCHIAAVRNDHPTLRKYTDQLLEVLSSNQTYAYSFFEMLQYVASYLLDMRDSEYVRKTLLVLEHICGGEEGGKLRVQSIWVRYYEQFGTEAECAAAYKRYHELKQVVDVTINTAMAEALHIKMQLHEATKLQEEMRQKNAALESEAQLDPLTQLYNRRSHAKLMERLHNDRSIKSVGIAMIDVDYFKEYNDNYGHTKGDEVLRAIAECMQLAAGDAPNIYHFRYGGDEFLCVYVNCTDNELAQHIDTVMEMVCGKKIEHRQSRCSSIVSLSIGYCAGVRTPNGELDTAELLAQADKALYWTKGRGRNGCSCYTAAMESSLTQEL